MNAAILREVMEKIGQIASDECNGKAGAEASQCVNAVVTREISKRASDACKGKTGDEASQCMNAAVAKFQVNPAGDDATGGSGGGVTPSDAPSLAQHKKYTHTNTHTSTSGSFSAASTPIFASEYSLFSIFRDLQDVHSFAALRSQQFRKCSSNVLMI